MRFVTQICGMRLWLQRTEGSNSLQALQTPPLAGISQSVKQIATVWSVCYSKYLNKSHLKHSMLLPLTLQIIFTYTKCNLSCSFKSDIFNSLKRHTGLLLLPALHKWHIHSQVHISLRAAAFARLVYLSNIYHLWILATLWERCTCIHTGHLPISHRLSVNMTQLKEMINVNGNAKTVGSYASFKDQAFGSVSHRVSDYECLPNKQLVGTVWQLFSQLLVQCTVLALICQIRWS